MRSSIPRGALALLLVAAITGCQSGSTWSPTWWNPFHTTPAATSTTSSVAAAPARPSSLAGTPNCRRHDGQPLLAVYSTTPYGLRPPPTALPVMATAVRRRRHATGGTYPGSYNAPPRSSYSATPVERPPIHTPATEHAGHVARLRLLRIRLAGNPYPTTVAVGLSDAIHRTAVDIRMRLGSAPPRCTATVARCLAAVQHQSAAATPGYGYRCRDTGLRHRHRDTGYGTGAATPGYGTGTATPRYNSGAATPVTARARQPALAQVRQRRYGSGATPGYGPVPHHPLYGAGASSPSLRRGDDTELQHRRSTPNYNTRMPHRTTTRGPRPPAILRPAQLSFESGRLRRRVIDDRPPRPPASSSAAADRSGLFHRAGRLDGRQSRPSGRQQLPADWPPATVLTRRALVPYIRRARRTRRARFCI